MGIHDGHRRRLKNRFLENGIDTFDDINTLELMLFYSIPRSDTNVIAHRLLDKFGSLHGVFDATFEQLTETDGISEHTATMIKLIPQIYSKYSKDKLKNIKKISSSKEAGTFFIPMFYGKTNEMLYELLLDDSYNILKTVLISDGNANSTRFDIKKIVGEAASGNATTVMLAHNHPQGVAIPSKDDIKETGKAMATLSLVGIKLIDHIIVSGDDYSSMADNPNIDIFRKR